MNLFSLVIFVLLQYSVFIHCVDLNHLKSPIPENDSVRSRRYVVMDNTKLNKRYQACTTTTNKKGHCKHLEYCVVSQEVKVKFEENAENSCLIKDSVVGICCPDHSETYNALGSSIIYNLPSTADEQNYTVIEGVSAVKSNTLRGCGIPTRSVHKAVYGPQAENGATPDDWPWMVAVMRGERQPSCGAVLITDRHILTAAHCFHGINNTGVLIRLGEYDAKDENETRHRDFEIDQIINHPEYDPVGKKNDITVISLKVPTNFNSYMWPICLPPAGRSFDGVRAYVAGWGARSQGAPLNNVLTQVDVPVWDQDRCIKALVGMNASEKVLCASERRRDSCQNDSGGPLMYQLENKLWVNIGVVSWGIGCGRPNKPGVYTSVNQYLPWIWENTIN